MASNHENKMGPVMLTALVASNMMGSGVFLLPTSLANIGSISIFGWIVTTIGALALAWLFARLSLRLPKAGGPYAYAKSALGDCLGFQTIYVYWLANWVGNIGIAVAGIGYLSFFYPVLAQGWASVGVTIAVIWLFTILNFFGARTLGKVISFTSCVMLIPLLGTALFGWLWFDSHNLSNSYNVTVHSDFWAITHSASLTLWAFIGVESAAVCAGMARNPRRDVPIATLAGTLIAAVVYILSSTAIMGIVPNQLLAHSAAPFSLVAELTLGSLAGKIVSICAIIACLGSLGGWILLVGGSAKAAADDKLFPDVFAKTNKKEVPVRGLIVISILMSILLLLTHSTSLGKQFQIIASVAVFLTLLPYLYSAIALNIFMQHEPAETHKYHRLEMIMSIAVMGYIFWAILGEGYKIVFWGLIVLLLGIAAYSWVIWNKYRGHQVLEEVNYD
jgi:arginine:agmatine antiporter